MRACKVLIVDDSEDDRLLMERELKRSVPSCTIVGTAHHGEMAVDYLSGVDHFSDRALFPFPDVILLDLRMPRMSGFDVLRWLRLQNLNDLTVIVLSTSILIEDVKTAMALGAHHYLVKELPRDTAAAIVGILQQRDQGTR